MKRAQPVDPLSQSASRKEREHAAAMHMRTAAKRSAGSAIWPGLSESSSPLVLQRGSDLGAGHVHVAAELGRDMFGRIDQRARL